MASPMRPRVENRRKRNVNPPINQPEIATPIYIASASKAAAVLTLSFDQPILLSGTPAFTTDLAGVTALSAAKTGPSVVAVTFSATIATATKLNIPFRDPAIRNARGGFVTSNQFPVT